MLKPVLCATFVFCLGLVSRTLPRNTLFELLPLLYCGALIASFISSFDKRDVSRSIFRPTSIMALYVSLSFLMGSFAFRKMLVLMQQGRQFEYYTLEEFSFISYYFFCAIGVTLLAQAFTPIVRTCSENARGVRPGPPLAQDWTLAISGLVIVVTPVIEVALPSGSSGGYSSIIFMFSAIHVAYFAKAKAVKYRYVIYAALACIFVASFYTNRRLFFYFIFILGFIEVFDKARYRLRPRTVGALVLLATCLVTMNIAMAIRRGVGGHETRNVVDALQYVDDYLTSGDAQTMLLHNFEGPATMFHSYRAVDYMIETGNYRKGMTFAKIIFLPVPRSVFPAKPNSMVYDYTYIYDPDFRLLGGSWVPNFYAEAFWNFGFWGGLPFLFVVFVWLDRVYLKGLRALRAAAKLENVVFLSSLALLPFFFRGSGLELYGLFVLVFYMMFQCYRLFAFTGVRAGDEAHSAQSALMGHQAKAGNPAPKSRLN